MPSLTRLASIGAVALTLVSAARGNNHGNSHSHLKRQNAGAVIGAPDGKVVPRLELRQLQADDDAWALFILAMNEFQNESHTGDVNSYYELAGIHGMPYRDWNGVAPYKPNVQSGYCRHADPCFISWHRPYVVAWEQAMLKAAQNVVNNWSGAGKDQMQSALGRLRYPYADFAQVPPSGNAADSVPTAMTSPQLTINTPSGKQTVQNPLYSYTKLAPSNAQDFAGYGGGDWAGWDSTLRYPSSSTDPHATSQDQQFIDAMNNNAAQIRAQIYRVLTACTNFLDISNDGATHSNSDCNIDLESIHNGIHSIIGGGGHMTYNNWSGYDAAFFLHHANMDRIFAMWQALHPDAWMPSTNSGAGETYTQGANTPIDGDSPLKPFADAGGNFYSTNSVRQIEKFFYTYPELQNDNNLIETINNLYGSNAKPESVQKPSISSSSSSASSTASSTSSKASSSSSSSAESSSSSSSKASSDSSAASSSTSAGITSSASNSAAKTTSAPSPSDIESRISSAMGSASTVLSNPAVSSAMSSAIAAGEGMGSHLSSVISSAVEAGATGAAGSGAQIGSSVSSAMSAGATGAASMGSSVGGEASSMMGGAGSMVSSILRNVGSMLSGMGGAGALKTDASSMSGALNTGASSASGALKTGASGASGALQTGATAIIGTAVSSGSIPLATGGFNSTLPNNGTSPKNAGSSPTDRDHDYYCHFVAERGGLGTTFNVYAFLGQAPSSTNPLEWMADKNYCGLWSNFAAMTHDKMAGHLVAGSVILTHCLQQKIASGDLKSMADADVNPYLAANLNWRTATGQGTQVQNNQVPGLTVGAVAQKIMPASNGASLPTYGQGNLVPAATHGKDGGYQTGMQYNWWDVCKAN